MKVCLQGAHLATNLSEKGNYGAPYSKYDLALSQLKIWAMFD
jgi:hypothetical protein